MAKPELILAASAKSMADSARNLETISEVFVKSTEDQNSLLGSMVDKLEAIAKSITKSSKTSAAAHASGSTAAANVAGIKGGLFDGLDGKKGKMLAENLKNIAPGMKEFANSIQSFAKIKGESVKAAAESIGIVADGILKYAKAAKKMIFIPNVVLNSMTKTIMDLLMNFAHVKGGKNIKDASVALGIIADGVIKYAKAAWVFKLAPNMDRMTDFIAGEYKDKILIKPGILTRFSDMQIDHKKIKGVANSLNTMSEAILGFGVSLALSTVFYAIGAVGSLIIVPMIMGYTELFEWVGKKKKDLEGGAKAIAWVGVGILSMALGLFAAKELAGGKFTDILIGSVIVAGAMLLFTGVFWLVDKIGAKNMEKSAEAFVVVGLSLASLALGIWSFQALKIGVGEVLVAGLSVLVVGGALGLIGKYFADDIDKGGFALIVSGLGLGSLALGIWSFQALKIGVADVLTAGLSVLVIGALLGVAGVFAVEIALGALVMIGSAIALWAVAKGIEEYKDIKLEDIGTAAGATVAIGAAFAAAGVASLFIGLGAGTMIIAGNALTSVAKGLKEFKDIKYTDDDAAMISKVMMSLTNAFSVAGGSGSASGGLFGFVKGVVKGMFGPNYVKMGAESMLYAGEALSSIGKGLNEFKKYNFGNDTELWSSIVMVVAGLGDSFSKMGKGHSKKPGILGFLGVETTDTEMGIKSVLSAGDALKSIADGLNAFRKLKLGRDEALDLWGDPALPFLNGKIPIVLAGISTAFAEIGGKRKRAGGLLGKLGYERNDVEEGINAVQGVGKTLIDIADGLIKFSKMDLDLTKNGPIMTSIVCTVTALSHVFGDIGLGNTFDAGGIRGILGAKDNSVLQGVESVKDLGKTIMDIADGLKKFSDTDVMKDLALRDKGKIIPAIIYTVTAISTVFGDIGSDRVPATGVWGEVFGAGDPKVKAGLEAVKGIGVEFKGIADGVKVFSEVKDFDKIKDNINNIIGAIPTAFVKASTDAINASASSKYFNIVIDSLKSLVNAIGKIESEKITDKTVSVLTGAISGIFSTLSKVDTNIDMSSLLSATQYIERLAKVADPIKLLADSFEKLAKNIEKFTTSFKKMDPPTAKIADGLIGSLVMFSKVDPNALDSMGEKGKALLKYVIEKTTTAPVAPVADTKAGGTTPATPQAAQAGVKDAPKIVAPSKKEDESGKQLQQMIKDLTTQMSAMASSLSSIDHAVNGKLKVITTNI